MRELEAKLLVSREFELPDVEQLVDGIRVGSAKPVALHAVYFDTPDLRLTRSGASLRYRTEADRRGGEWTVKLPISNRSVTERSELEFAGDPGTPAPAALDLLRGWTRSTPVEEIAHVDTARSRFTVTDALGTKIAEIDDDRVTTTSRWLPRARFREVEIELEAHAPRSIAEQVVKHIRAAAGSASASSQSKVARAVGWKPAAPDAGDVKTAAALAQVVIGRSVTHLLAHDPVIRLGEDPEGVHQARVATRRLRSDLRTFGPILVPRRTGDLRNELRWLGTALGRARDADALDELFRAEFSRLPDDDGEDTDEIFDRLDELRSRERGELLRCLRSERYEKLLDRLEAAAKRLPTNEAADRPARKVAVRLTRRPCRRLYRAVRALAPDAPDATLHKVRRRAKQARYALEAVALVDERAIVVATRAEKIQQVLGDYQDRVVARRWLLETVRTIDRPETAFAAGELAAGLRAEQRELRTRGRHACRSACKHGLRLD